MQQSLSPAGGANPQTWVEVGKLATIDGSMMIVEDRDMSGMVVASHDGAEFGAWQDAKGYKPIIGNKKPEYFVLPGRQIPSNSGSTGLFDFSSGKPLSASREDGYGDAYGNVFQGVRVYDPTSAQWTAPDAYAGDVHDPMSQKPFMWNGNNPLDFEDPSGYISNVTVGKDKKVQIDVYVTYTGDTKSDAGKDTIKRFEAATTAAFDGQRGGYAVNVTFHEAR